MSTENWSNSAFKAPIYALTIMFLFLASACGTQRKIINPLHNRTSSFIVKNLDTSRDQLSWLSAKVTSETRIDGNNSSFKINLRLRKDSAIWMSVSPALGIEVARVLLSVDSVKFIDKWNDRFYLGDYSYLNEGLDLAIDFDQIQSLIIGSPFLFDESEKFLSNTDELNYTLTSKTKRKIRKAVGIKNQKKDPLEIEIDSTSTDFSEKKFRRVIENNEDNEFVVKRYWVNPDNFAVSKTMVHDLYTDRLFELSYKEYHFIDQILLPIDGKIDITSPDKSLKFDFKMSRLKVNSPQAMPFNIPEKFKRIN